MSGLSLKSIWKAVTKDKTNPDRCPDCGGPEFGPRIRTTDEWSSGITGPCSSSYHDGITNARSGGGIRGVLAEHMASMSDRDYQTLIGLLQNARAMVGSTNPKFKYQAIRDFLDSLAPHGENITTEQMIRSLANYEED